MTSTLVTYGTFALLGAFVLFWPLLIFLALRVGGSREPMAVLIAILAVAGLIVTINEVRHVIAENPTHEDTNSSEVANRSLNKGISELPLARVR